MTAEIKLNNQSIKFDLKRISNTKYEICLTPTQSGVYQIHIYLNGHQLRDSPFKIRIDEQEYDEILNVRGELVGMTPTSNLKIEKEVFLNGIHIFS